MKNTFKRILSFILAVSTVCIFAGCDDDKKQSSSSSQNESSTSTTDIETDIKALHYYDPDSTDPFSGAWQITDGVGSDLESFVFLFDGYEAASLVVGSTGYVGTYSVDETEDGETFTTQLLFGLDGTYTYEFSDENTNVVLTNTADNSTTTMQKVASFDCIPIPDTEPKIDEALLGAWESDNNETLYFDKSGIMYQNYIDFMYYYYKYSAEDSVVTATYYDPDEYTTDYDYSIDGDTLDFGGTLYTRIPASEIV